MSVSDENVVTATDRDVVNANSINVLLLKPIAILPLRSGEAVRAFSSDFFPKLRSLRRPGVTDAALRAAVAAYIYSKRYYLALAQPGAQRYDLDGRPTGAVTAYQQKVAQKFYLP